MKKIIVLLTCVFAFFIISHAQDSTRRKHRIYKVTATTTDSIVKGYLASVADSSVFISSKMLGFKSTEAGNRPFRTISYNNLTEVSLRRKGSAGRGILKGTAIGFLSGALISAITYQEPKDDVDILVNALFGINRGTMAVASGMLGGLAGGVVGGVIGALTKKTFVIGGKKEKFDGMKAKL